MMESSRSGSRPYLYPYSPKNIGQLTETVCCLFTELCPNLFQPQAVAHKALLSMKFPRKNTGVGCHFLLQGSSWPRDQTHISCIGRQVLYHWATSKTLKMFQFSSFQFSRSVMSNSLRPHESQHARPPCPSPAPGVHSNSLPSSRWCHPAISSSVGPFSSCPQSLPASESFPMSQLFAWGGQS